MYVWGRERCGCVGVSVYNVKCFKQPRHSSGAVWESRWTSWAVRPNEPSGFRGRKDLLPHRASALVTTCPKYVSWHLRTSTHHQQPRRFTESSDLVLLWVSDAWRPRPDTGQKTPVVFVIAVVNSVEDTIIMLVNHSSGAVWESRWPSWAVRPNEFSGFRGRKAVLNHASALVSACP